MADPFLTSLLNGDIIGFVISCYTSTMGQGFYAFVLLIVFGVLYNQTKSLAVVGIVYLLLGGVWIVSAVVASPIAVILVVLGLVGILYGLFGRST